MSTARFPLPDVGEGLTEAEIVSWRVAPGDTITINQVIVEIETAKSLVELPSPFAGTVTELLVDEGQTVEVGTPIISVETVDGAPTPSAPSVPEIEADAVADTAASIATEESGSGAVLVGYGAAGHATSRRQRPGTGAAAPVSAPLATPFAERAKRDEAHPRHAALTC